MHKKCIILEGDECLTYSEILVVFEIQISNDSSSRIGYRNLNI